MKLTIDSGTCTGHGLCHYTAPALFSDNERGVGVLIGDGTVPEGQLGVAERAQSLCPEQAVHLLTDEAATE
jgi:ferredoxin